MSAVESATTVEPATAMETSPAVESVAVAPASVAASPTVVATVASPIAMSPPIAMAPIATPAVVPTTVVPTAIVRTPVISRSIIAVIPGAYADEHAADEVARPVKSIGRAGIRIIVIVAIRANRRRPNRVSRTIAHAHSDLRRRMYCRYSQQDSKQREVL